MTCSFFKRSLQFVTAIAICLVLHHAQAQNNYETQRYIPPTPLAQSFKIYGDIPVSYSTGVPDISIPLYTIEVGDYSLPIVLRYHINQLKPGNCKSNVALGWTLDYGGMLSRSVYDRVDEGSVVAYDPPPNPSDPYSEIYGKASNAQLLNMWKINGSDNEHDIYNYSIPNASGEFIDESGYRLMSDKPVKIMPAPNNSFDITDDKGIVYKFGYGSYQFVDNAAHGRNVSSWLLSSVGLPTNKSIGFTYEDIPRYTITARQNTHAVSYDVVNRYGAPSTFPTITGLGGPQPPSAPILTYNDYASWIGYEEKNIKSITFPGGTITFSLSSDKRIITGLTVANNNGTIRQYEFGFSAAAAIGDMKLLERIVVHDGDSNPIEEYKFEYNNAQQIGEEAGTDWWGYYNGGQVVSFPCGDYTYTPRSFYPPVPYSVTSHCQNKDANEIFCKAGSIKKIIYPTKGETEFVFELHQLNQNVSGGGLRIKEIKNSDGNGKVTKRTFTYPFPMIYYTPISKNDALSVTYGVGELQDDPVGEYYMFHWENKYYETSVSSRVAPLLSPRYGVVTEYLGDANANIGRNVYYFNSKNSNNHELWVTHEYNILKHRDWDNYMLDKKESYRSNENSPYTVTDYYYQYHYNDPVKNTYLRKLSTYHSDINEEERIRNLIEGWQHVLHMPLPHLYTYFNYDIVTGWVELVSQTETTVTPTGSIANTTDYEYNGGKKYYPSKTIRHNSDGSTTNIARQYPYDYANLSPYSTMVARNMVAPVISEQEINTVNGSSIDVRSEKTNFSDWGNGILMPVNIQKSTSGGPLKNRLEFDRYDESGNVIQLHKTNDIYRSYLYDSNRIYPIAEVLNAQLKDVFYTSFEDTNGNSSRGDSKTGFKSRTNGYSQTLSGLTNGSYTLAYWSKVNGIWQYQANNVVVNNGTFTINVAGQVDELRFYPSDAQMSTYAYDPLVGIVNVTDSNGGTTQYSYDKIQRLNFIRDNDGNIVKAIEYQYRKD